MARSGARRKQQATPKPPGRGARKPESVRHEFAAAEAGMFFPRLRRQAKWMFVFLALTFGIGFVAFGIGGTGGTSIGDLLRTSGGASSGPSVSDAQEKIDKGDLAAYKDLNEAYLADNKQDEALAAGEKYIKARPNDYEFKRSLANNYEAKAALLRQQAETVQADLTATTGGTTF